MHWLSSMRNPPGDPRDAVATLERLMRPANLAGGHPFSSLWQNASARSARALHHLADDLRVIESVPGALGLIAAMRGDAQGYDAYRYEARMAAAVGRPKGQKLIRLAGKNAGPDIEFTSRSGHRCGMACYRACSATPTIKNLQVASDEVMRRAFSAFMFSSIDDTFTVEVIFGDTRNARTQVNEAVDLLTELVTNPTTSPELESGGVRGRRVERARHLLHPGDYRRVRVRFMFPVRAHELERVKTKFVQKVSSESDSWARGYDGVPLLTVEESDGLQGAGVPDLQVVLDEGQDVFCGALLTWLPHSTPESVKWVPRTMNAGGLHVEVQTFQENMTTWSGDLPVVTMAMDHAHEDWDFVHARTGYRTEVVESLHSGTHVMRLKRRPSKDNPSEDAAFQQELTTAIARIRAESTAFRRAPVPLM